MTLSRLWACFFMYRSTRIETKPLFSLEKRTKMLKRNLKLVQATRNAGAIPIAVNEPILVSYSIQSGVPGPGSSIEFIF